jgi:general secretion pathway protein K
MTVSLRRQRGVALLVALLAVALAAVLIAGLLDRGELTLARTRNALRAEQAQAYAQGLEAYAVEVLIKDFDEGHEDSHSDLWAAPLPPQQVPGGMIMGSLVDLNGCFNLNNLGRYDADSTWHTLFVRLLRVTGVDISLADAVKDWLAVSDTTDAYYLAQPVPYRSAQRAFVHVSELRLVRGFSSDVYAKIAPYVCALPAGTVINVNTATAPVLQTLGDGITRAQAESLWNEGRADYGAQFWNADEWKRIPLDPQIFGNGAPRAPSYFGAASSYFLARADIRLDDIPFTFFSVIERTQGATRVIERSRGSDDALVAPVAEPDRR